jgi:hypothetical protein
MTEAEERLAMRLAQDIEGVLGAGIVLNDVQIETGGRTLIRLVCLVDGVARPVEIEATDVLEAYRAAIRAAAEVRLAAAWSRLVAPT